MNLYDLFDQLYKCAKTTLERNIIKLRLEERKDTEIANILGVSITTVLNARRAIERRFNTKQNEVDAL